MSEKANGLVGRHPLPYHPINDHCPYIPSPNFVRILVEKSKIGFAGGVLPKAFIPNRQNQ